MNFKLALKKNFISIINQSYINTYLCLKFSRKINDLSFPIFIATLFLPSSIINNRELLFLKDSNYS